jgi:hypothetical protein
VVQLTVRGYISHYKIRRFYPNPPSLTWLIVVYNQMSSIVDIFIATKINHKDKICSFKTSCVAAQHIICKHSEHGQINTRRQPIICMAIKHGEYNEWLQLLNMASTMNDWSYKTWRVQWMMLAMKNGDYNEWL